MLQARVPLVSYRKITHILYLEQVPEGGVDRGSGCLTYGYDLINLGILRVVLSRFSCSYGRNTLNGLGGHRIGGWEIYYF